MYATGKSVLIGPTRVWAWVQCLAVAILVGALTSCGGSGGGDVLDGPECGNGREEGSEECDDGNTQSGDGCSKKCKDEAARVCAPPDGVYRGPTSQAGKVVELRLAGGIVESIRYETFEAAPACTGGGCGFSTNVCGVVDAFTALDSECCFSNGSCPTECPVGSCEEIEFCISGTTSTGTLKSAQESGIPGCWVSSGTVTWTAPFVGGAPTICP